MNSRKQSLASLGIFSVVLSLAVCTACGKREDPLEKGKSAYEAGNYQVAASQFKLAADNGNADAMFHLGLCYHDGFGVEKDANEAVKWYQKAVNGGNAEAQAYLDALTSVIDEVKQLTEAAENGDADAMRTVAFAYFAGSGVKPSDEEAAKWFLKAAENGNVSAMYDVGLCYEQGVGVKTNAEEAVKWFRMSADKGFADGLLKLSMCYQNGFGVEKDEAEAEKWYGLYDEKEKQGRPSVSASEAKIENETGGRRKVYRATTGTEELFFDLIRNVHTRGGRDVLVGKSESSDK